MLVTSLINMERHELILPPQIKPQSFPNLNVLFVSACIQKDTTQELYSVPNILVIELRKSL